MIEHYKKLAGFYLRAKDHHQPHLMERVFAENAILEMKVNTDAISFPPRVVGLDNITETLVTDFHLQYANFYTFCIDESAIELRDELRCRWLVGMTDLKSESLRIGYGDYHWSFDGKKGCAELRVNRLIIFISDMIALPVPSNASVLPWLDSLPHPWASIADLSLSAPDLPIIDDLLSIPINTNDKL